MGKYISTIISFTLTWYAISPFAWNDPVRSFMNTFQSFSHYYQWNGTMVFMGKLITCEEMPWYYLFVWFAISIPIMILLFFIIGNLVTMVHMVKSKEKLRTIVKEDRWPLFFMIIFWGPVLSVIILKSRIYVGWHHLYFVFVPMCVVAGYGIRSAYFMWNKKIISCVIGMSLLYQLCWITVYHPHESSFFNVVGKYYAAQFDREEWRTSAYTALQWIIENESKPVSIGGEITSYNSLSEEQKAQVIRGEENPLYIIDGYRNVIGNEISYIGYDEIYTITVDGYHVCTVFKKVE